VRIRSIKPEFFKDDKLADLAPVTRILFAGLWCLADCEGRLADRPRQIKAEALPYDDCDVDAALQSLHDGGFIQRYQVGDKRVILIVNFKRHQRISGKEAATKSELPAPPAKTETCDESVNQVTAHELTVSSETGKQLGSTGEALGKQRGSNGEATGKHLESLEGKGREGKGKEGNVYPAPLSPDTRTESPKSDPRPCVEAVERWSQDERRHGLSTSEHAELSRRLLAMPQYTRWFAQAVQRKRRDGCQFKSVKYVMAAVLDLLDEWGDTGPPAADAAVVALTPEAVWNRARTSLTWNGRTATKNRTGWNAQGIVLDGKPWIPAEKLPEVKCD
jgi:hypothetical protein